MFVPALVVLFTSLIASSRSWSPTRRAWRRFTPSCRCPPLGAVGHYAWALECFLATALAGTALSALLARAEGLPFGGGDLMTMLTLSWALFALNIAIQFPLLIRFGYARISVLGTTMPLAVVLRPSTDCTRPSRQSNRGYPCCGRQAQPH